MLLSGIDFERSIKTGRVKWTDEGLFNHYVLFLMPVLTLVIAIMNISDYQYYIWQIWFAVSVFFSLFVLATIKKNDKLVKVPFNGTFDELRQHVEEVFKAEGWKVTRSNREFLTAYRSGKWLAGSRLTILNYKGDTFVNVINLNGFRGYMPFSFGRNKRITIGLMQTIQQVQRFDL